MSVNKTLFLFFILFEYFLIIFFRIFIDVLLTINTQNQPNRRTGICDSDVFSIDGGVTSFVLCGQNSGQHSEC